MKVSKVLGTWERNLMQKKVLVMFKHDDRYKVYFCIFEWLRGSNVKQVSTTSLLDCIWLIKIEQIIAEIWIISRVYFINTFSNFIHLCFSIMFVQYYSFSVESLLPVAFLWQCTQIQHLLYSPPITQGNVLFSL